VAHLRTEVLAFLRLRDSEHVVAQAQRALEALRSECEAPHGGVRRRVYDLYGECRFAFREALHMWPENETARAGLVTSATLVIERELARDPRVAVALLEEAPELAPELVARVQRATAAELDEREGLSKLARAHDQHTGIDGRRVFFVILGLSWTASQFADRLGAPMTHMRFAVASLCELPLLAVAWMISREMMKTLFNRRLLAVVGLMLVAQSAFFFCAHVLGVDLVATRALQLGLWATVSACATICLERRFWPMTLALALALAVTVRWTELRAVAGAVSSLTVTVNALALWRRGPRPSKR
jgi:serine/threonine-protein kinase